MGRCRIHLIRWNFWEENFGKSFGFHLRGPLVGGLLNKRSETKLALLAILSNWEHNRSQCTVNILRIIAALFPVGFEKWFHLRWSLHASAPITATQPLIMVTTFKRGRNLLLEMHPQCNAARYKWLYMLLLEQSKEWNIFSIFLMFSGMFPALVFWIGNVNNRRSKNSSFCWSWWYTCF